MVILLELKFVKKNNLTTIIHEILHNNNSFEIYYKSTSLEDTYILANKFASELKKKDVININGELGAGKTAFVTSLAKSYNIEDQVSSPTFTIVNEYILKNNTNLYHFDVYRLEDSNEFYDCIGTDYFENGICIIEWGNIIKDVLPKNSINIDITKDTTEINTRIFKIWR